MLNRPKPKKSIPMQVKVVYKGELYKAYRWNQKLYDGSIKTYEGIRRKDSVNILPITKKGDIILNRQIQPRMEAFISGFGGKIEKNETPLKAAKRELLEEAGLKAKKWKLWFAVQPTEIADWVIFTFIAKDLKSAIAGNPESGEKIKKITVSPKRLIALSKKDYFRDKHISLYLYKNDIDEKRLKKILQTNQ